MRGNQKSYKSLDRGHPKAGLDRQFPSSCLVCSRSGACMDVVEELKLLCSICKIEKFASRFSRKSGTKRGYSYKCKDCHNTYVRESWYPNNTEKHIESSAKWRTKNPFRIKATSLGLREKDVELVWGNSNGECAVCKSTHKLVLDHCHETNVPRGVLCSKCNLLLGHLGDTVESVAKTASLLIAYLNNAPKLEPFEK